MNLKESFRYQSFIDNLMSSAAYSIQAREHSLKTVKTHNRNAANPEAENITEDVVCPDIFYPNDEVIDFMKFLVIEKERLSTAIGNAKKSIDFDLDAAIETNKQRQRMASAIKAMLRYTPSNKTETGKDYKFNAEGNQTAYFYNVDVSTTEAFDRAESKATMKSIIAEADEISTKIDSAMINTVVDYTPPYDVNDSFDDVMAEYTGK